MRVLHILDHSLPLHSGYAFRTDAILRHQRAMGWETFQLTGPKHTLPAPPRETVGGLEFYRTPPVAAARDLPVLRELAVMRSLTDRIEEVISRVEPDILHVHSPILNALPTIRVGARNRLPVLYEVRASWEDAAVSHGSTRQGSLRYRLSRALETHAVRRSDAVTTICEGLRRDLIDRGLPARKVTVIPNAVDPADFDGDGGRPRDLAPALALEGKTVLAFIGSFYAYEGLDLLLRVMPRLLDRDPNIRLLLVGGGPEEANLKAMARSLGVADKVIFAGRIPHQEICAYYGLADIMVYPRQSIRLTEMVTPLKPLEAMAARKVVLASNVGGHRELIRDGETGHLFAPENVGHLAATVHRVMAARASWPAWAERGRRFVESKRTWADSVRRYGDVYRGLLAARGHRPAGGANVPVAG